MMNVIGIGDNVVDKYVHTQTMYPGGNALNFAAYAAMLRHNAAYLGILVMMPLRNTLCRCWIKLASSGHTVCRWQERMAAHS